MKKTLLALIFAASFLLTAGKAIAEQSVVEGKIVKVVESKQEIYVYADGEKHEYYFNEKTEILAAGEKAPFSNLKEGLKVRVTAEKVGKRLDPKTVEILG